MAAGKLFLTPRLKACKASRDGVVARSRGVLYFCTVLKDSPSLLRISEAAFPSASRTWFLSFACPSVVASKSPLAQLNRLENQIVSASDQGYRTLQCSDAACPLTNFLSNLGWESR